MSWSATTRPYRIGQIVPSSNVTMETEIPALLRARETVAPERFTFHSSRMRMTQVTADELAAMDAQSDRCAVELSDARVDVLGYACLVAIMSMGPGYHRESQRRLHQRTVDNGGPAPVVTSAGALVDGLRVLDARRIVLIAPYLPALTRTVVDYIEAEGVTVLDHLALGVPDNLDVAALDPRGLIAHARELDRSDADAVVLSACVQMPSLAVLDEVQELLGKPVLSAAAATTHRMLRALDLPAFAPLGGALLGGDHALADPPAVVAP
ncbi:Asp/Glu racemase [Pseudonocardia sp. N23]|uniref:maleate cis-trans isomerase family protein n=1 Tax=Pseudonocardia sp. N23 TaxID=1987376 RepID=UPI000BFCEF46|nr:Asp/Glu racemase [Pseudonocardia sp. N23]GAY07257.1 Maleate cis-trans isomerase [Pseudonocardia sp. N23]